MENNFEKRKKTNWCYVQNSVLNTYLMQVNDTKICFRKLGEIK